MGQAGRLKLKKATELTTRNIARDTITEVEIFVNTAKAFVHTKEARDLLDEAFARLRTRVFDISGAESRRLQRYLDTWEVEQTSEELDWVEYGDRF